MSDKIEVPKYPPAWFVKMLDRFRLFLIKIAGRLMPPEMRLFEIIQNIPLSRCLFIAADLNIAEILKDSPKSISELARLTNTRESLLYRLMRALASQGIFKEVNDRFFDLTPLAHTLKDGQGSWRYFVLNHTGDINWDIFRELPNSIKTGENAAKKVLGMSAFEFLKKNPERNQIFNKSMTNSSDIASAAVLSAYNFSGITKIVDVGGGQGYLLSIILNKYKSMNGVVMDLPYVVTGATKNFDKFKLNDRAIAVPGNFFENVPEGGDAYILKSVIHDWNDQDCIKILKNIHQTMATEGKLLVVEIIIMEDNKPSFGKLSDIQMLVGTTGGKERTRKEYEDLYKNAGFKISRIKSTVAPFSIIEGIKI